jgi:hypothetical protein
MAASAAVAELLAVLIGHNVRNVLGATLADPQAVGVYCNHVYAMYCQEREAAAALYKELHFVKSRRVALCKELQSYAI